jgi:hypothetical protein
MDRRRRVQDTPQSVRALRLTWYRDTAKGSLPRYRADVPEGWLTVQSTSNRLTRWGVSDYKRLRWEFALSWVKTWDVDPFLDQQCSRARLAMMKAEQVVMRWRDIQVQLWGGRVLDDPAPGPFLAGASRPRAIALMDDDDE